ncbi:MAG: hypothetical protein AAGJ83_12850, partial [Planctomycetota bacterium]
MLIKSEQFIGLNAITAKYFSLYPDNEDVQFYRAYALLASGQHHEAYRLFRKVEDSDDYGALAKYNIACILAIGYNRGPAFEYLEDAIDSGLCSHLAFSRFYNDDDLCNLKGDPRFAKLVRKFRSTEDAVAEKEMALNGKTIIIMEEENESETYNYDECDEPPSIIGVRSVVDGLTAFAASRSLSFAPATSLIAYTAPADRVVGTWWVHSQGDADKFLLMRKLTETGMPVSSSIVTKPPGEDIKSVLSSERVATINRAAGQLTLSATGASQKLSGEFDFHGSFSFEQMLRERGVRHINETVLFYCFCRSDENVDETIDHLKTLESMGLSNSTLSSLVAANISLESVEQYRDADLSVDQSVPMLVSRVPVKLVKQYRQAGLDPAEHDEWLQARVPASIAVKRVAEAKRLATPASPASSRRIQRLPRKVVPTIVR